MKSQHSILLIALVWFILGGFYYPKWNKPWSEAAISWDVSGYYHYLPAIFIYKDIRQQNWMNAINEKYLPSPAYDQAFGHQNSGNKVNKYAIGQAVLFSPFFLTAHAYANITNSFPADGYSKPYQFAVWFGSLLFSILGLILLRKILLHYFDDSIVTMTLLALGLGTHWMEYASISNGMNHTWLFTLLCGLIVSTIRFYKKKDWTSIFGIGVSLGLAILTRPTEIIWALIPLLWGITTIKDRYVFLLANWKKCLVAIIITGMIMSIQAIYWKYASGEWIVYSYGGQGFNWFNPKIWRGLMGVSIGWWTYTPLMLIAMFGWYGVYKKHRNIFWPTFITSTLAIYITLSWAHFESGGGLGQRNLIQIYPLMAFPLATLIGWFYGKGEKWIWTIILLGNIYYSGWWIHQAHKGGFFLAGQMTTPYFYSVVGRLHPDPGLIKLLDTREYFRGIPKELSTFYQNDFELDSTVCKTAWPPGGTAACLNGEQQFYGPVNLPVAASCFPWIRLEADFISLSKEWDIWKNTQWIVQFFDGDQVVKTNLIKVERFLPTENTPTHIFFDVRLPSKPYTRCAMTLWHANSTQTLLMDNLKVSCFK